MALTLTIGGVDKTSLLKDGSLDVEKVGPTESMRLDILVGNDNTASAYRPAVGDVVRLLHNADLLMGGPIVRVEDRRLGGDTGTVTRITVRDWMFLAEQVIIEDRYFEPQGAYDLFDALVDTYLADKGVTNIGSTTGGPTLPELFVKGETLLSVFHQITEQTGYPFRINGDKECALVEPGSLVWPSGSLTDANILDGLTWTKDELVQANRLHLTTGTPESGAGPVTHGETHVADGTLQVFPVNVIPNRSLVGTIDNAAGYAAAATSLALKDLTAGMAILAGNSLTAQDQTSTYVVQSDVTVGEDGKVTVTISPGLDADVDDNDPVTFSDETGIALEVNGTPTDLFGSPWVWDRLEQAVVNPSAAPSNGDEITVSHRVTFPAVVRVWETASVNVQDAQGHFDWAVVVDGTLDEGDQQHHTDLGQAATYARDVLSRRLTPPKIVRCTTFEPGWYPFLSTTITWGARLLSGSYMVDSVRVRQVGIDPAATTEELPYELELVEGDALRQSWVSYYRGQNPARGIRWGRLPDEPPPSPVVLLDVTVPGATGSQAVTGAGATPRAVFALSALDAKGTTGAGAQICIGAAGPASSIATGAIRSTSAETRVLDNAATTTVRWSSTNAAFVENVSASVATVVQSASVTSFDADGATLDWTDVDTGGGFGLLTFPDSFLTGACTGTVQLATSAGNVDVTCQEGTSGVAFEPDVVLLWASNLAGTSITQTHASGHAQPFLGVAVNGGFQGCASWADEAAAAAANSYQYLTDDAALRPLTIAGALLCDATVSFLSTGFRLTFATGAPVASYIRFLALKGGIWTAGVASAPTSPGTQVLDVTGMWPSAVIAAGIGATTLDTIANGFNLAVGVAARNPANHYAIWGSSVDAADPSQADKAVQNNLLYFGTDNAPGTVRARASVSVWAEDAITLNWPDASTAFRYLWLAMGTTP